jgi:hypothetical protein
MESWMITSGIVVAGIIGNAYITRYVVTETKKSVNTIFDRLDKHGDDIVRLNTKSELSMTAKDVDDKYVSKELFRQFEKHMDARFDSIENGQQEILNFIKG